MKFKNYRKQKIEKKGSKKVMIKVLLRMKNYRACQFNQSKLKNKIKRQFYNRVNKTKNKTLSCKNNLNRNNQSKNKLNSQQRKNELNK